MIAERVILAGNEENDVKRILTEAGIEFAVCEDADTAVKLAQTGAAILIFADDYPNVPLSMDAKLLERAAKKNVRIFVEFPETIPGVQVAAPRHVTFERGVIASRGFTPRLEPMQIVMLQDCTFIPVNDLPSHMVLAKVAGYDNAVYGLTDTEVYPLLFTHPTENILIATTQFSRFIRARFAPADAWEAVWNMILGWLLPGEKIPDLTWTSVVRPAYLPNTTLAPEAENKAIVKGTEWFYQANIFMDPSWRKIYDDEARDWQMNGDPVPNHLDWPHGNGECGALEGLRSNIRRDGSQEMSWWVRNDCNAEIIGALAFSGTVNRQERYLQTARNLDQFVYQESILSQGDRAREDSPEFGLIGWNDVARYSEDLNGFGVYYGDDNARGLLAGMAANSILDSAKTRERLIQCLLANFRTTSPTGFRRHRIDTPDLVKNGWQYYFETPFTNYSPHYQSYLWACYLRAYEQTKYAPLLERSLAAITAMMETYPNKWHWTNGIQQERARMLLPLAWLYRVTGSDEHLKWLHLMADELLAYQTECGGIREALGDTANGKYHAPQNNSEYGTTEAPLIQADGDPVCDWLYTANFAFLGLHEAATATGDSKMQAAVDKMAELLCRIQVKSESHPELDGAWFRAFDMKRWDYWGSAADIGWGPWCVESGWTQGWILMVLAFRKLNTTLWDTWNNQVPAEAFEKIRKQMGLPE
ncbi:hypothetical protein KAH55_03875 [bacterium]|nr:hypothetical protein [bacterium]